LAVSAPFRFRFVLMKNGHAVTLCYLAGYGDDTVREKINQEKYSYPIALLPIGQYIYQ
jgi:hypothetical protein